MKKIIKKPENKEVHQLKEVNKGLDLIAWLTIPNTFFTVLSGCAVTIAYWDEIVNFFKGIF